MDAATGEWETIAFAVGPMLVVSPDEGLNGDKISVTGYGFQYDDENDEPLDVMLVFRDLYGSIPTTFVPTTPKTNMLGTFTATMTVPNVEYTAAGNVYEVYAEDELGVYAEEPFTVGPAITLNIVEGPVGSLVILTGRGFQYEAGGDIGEVAFGDLEIDGVDAFIVNAPILVRSGGRLTVQFVVPSIDADDDPYTVWVTDGFWEATAKFTVNGEAAIKATPGYGIQGTTVTVEGWNFTKIANKDVVVTLEDAGAKTFKTDAKGYFKGTYQIPAVPTGTDLALEAVQDDYFIYGDSTLRVGVMLVILSPDSGPSGSTVSVTGVGFKEEQDYELTISGVDWHSGEVGVGGGIAIPSQADPTVLYVPTLSPGVHTVAITELDDLGDPVITVSTSFTVTETTRLELDPSKAANNYEITIKGFNYADDTYTS